MALIICAIFDTDDNGRSEYTEKTLESLRKTVYWKSGKHRLVLVDNGSCEKTKSILSRCVLDMRPKKYATEYEFVVPTIITNVENLGTAKAINQGLKLRKPNEYVTKCDNDIEFHKVGWVDEMEEAIERDPSIGILGLKRKDIEFDTNHNDPQYRSQLIQLPHQPGETWITVEKGPSIMGTCTMFNWRLIDKINGMKQSGVYGNDDSLYSLRSLLAGFWNAYLPHINLDHIDNGQNPYTQEKHRQASESWHEYTQLHEAYINGTRQLWEDFE